MKLTNKHLELFKKECLKWQDKFELNNWELCFKWMNKGDARATINYQLSGYLATLKLGRDNNADEYLGGSIDNDIKISAKHEMIHLLIGRLEQTGSARYISIDELSEAKEELVRKLEVLL